ncbi:hypothetical protein VDG1235_4215 [Verrucomicrobiia bacterium DG1235]|nr:hypothetical protein VDG1235_4215 [Verrucomicrobiae bacterium DG1235]
MKLNRNYEVHKCDESVRLRYPLEDWIEQLLRKYPEELASIRPERARKRSRQLRKMERSLKERVRRQLF